MAHNSFTHKGWMLTILTGAVAFSTQQVNEGFLYIGLIPVIGFWGLDAYYLRQERLFRKPYDHVRTTEKVDFSMDISPFNKDMSSWWCLLFSKTIFWLYVPSLAVVLRINYLN